MLSLSTLILAAALGQAPTDAAWLDAVPAQTDVIVRMSGAQSVQKDLNSMIKAFSPSMGQAAEPAIAQGVAALTGYFGDVAAKEPFSLLIRAVAPEDQRQPPVAVLVRASNYDAVLKAFGEGKAPELKKEDGGFESFVHSTGSTIFIAKNGGQSMFGPDRTLVAAFAKGGGKSFVTELSEGDKKRLNNGDASIAVNVEALASRYAEAIDGAKQAFIASLDKAPQQPATAAMMGNMKKVYAALFDKIKQAKVLTLALDFAGAGLNVNVGLSVKEGSDLAKTAAAIKPGTADVIGSLPPGAAVYVYMNLDAKTYESMQKWSLSLVGADAKPTPALDAVLEKQGKLGRVEAFGHTTIGGGMNAVNIVRCSDPKVVLNSYVELTRAMGAKEGGLGMFKEVKVTDDAESYKGYKFSKCEVVLDVEKFASLQPAGGGAAMFNSLYGGDRLTTWYGVNDSQLVSATGKTWEQAKAQLDAVLEGDKKLSTTPGFKAVRPRLSNNASLLMMMSMQGLAKQFATQFGAMANNFNIKVPADMPAEPAFVGLSVSAAAGGYELDLVIPSEVGPVVEKGIVPLFQSLRLNQ